MKKFIISTVTTIIIYAMLVTVIFYSCNLQPQNENIEVNNGDYVTKVIDSCEYIEYDSGVLNLRVHSLIHKGNCKFCAERNKK